MSTLSKVGYWYRCLAIALLCLGTLQVAYAHKASDAYLLWGTPIAGQPADALSLSLSLAVRDLDAAIELLDADDNRSLTWGEIRQSIPAIENWIAKGFGLECAKTALDLRWTFQSMEQRSDGPYIRFGAATSCTSQSALALSYGLMKGIDPSHRLLIGGNLQGQSMASVLASDSQTRLSLRSEAAESGSAVAGMASQTPGAVFSQFFSEGVHHIVTGYDHLAFLLALVLPIMLRKSVSSSSNSQFHPPGLGALVRTVTGFTVGHCITLVLASMGWLTAPGWIEPVIAITIAVAALLNLCPVRWVRSDALALGFGLIHGVAFSEVIREAGINGKQLWWALGGFNLGVEAGQLAGVFLWCALHLLLVRWDGYERWIVRGGSWGLLILAIGWTVQRIS